MAGKTSIAGIMFLDVKNFSALTAPQLTKFVDVILPEIAETIEANRDELLDANTWGDAIVVISKDTLTTAKIALAIRDYFKHQNLEAKGLPKNLLARISVHVGRTEQAYDPIRQREGIFGPDLTVAARIEPIVVPGEVWATREFASTLNHVLQSERLAFDELGSQQLAKGFRGKHELLRLRRESEGPSFSKETQDAFRKARHLANSMRAYDVVGIGSLNTDFIATASNLSKLRPEKVKEHEKSFELGKERPASDEEVLDTVATIGKTNLVVTLGGSSFNSINAIANAVKGLRLAYVGVAGKTEAELSFVNMMEKLGIDSSLVRESDQLSGTCVSYITHSERSMLTSPGVNTKMYDHLVENRNEIIDMLGRARIVHVTSLFDEKSPEVLADILQEAKIQNPWLQVSFDPGHDWARRVKTGDKSGPIEQLLNLTTYLFVNNVEFELLSSDLHLDRDRDLALKIFDRLSPQAVLILLKRYNEIKVFHKLNKRLKEFPYHNSPLGDAEIEDATGAGDVFVAGLFAAILIPGLELKDGIKLGLRLVRSKLTTVGIDQYSTFGNIVDDYVDEAYALEEGTTST